MDLSGFEQDDGPAAFLILVVGFLNVFGALLLEIRYAPPAWVQFAIWVPLSLVLVFTLLRSFKGVRVALQYRNRPSADAADHARQP